MHICILKKQTTKLSLFFLSLLCGNAFASTSLVVNGHAGLSGLYTTNTPPLGRDYFAFRVPVGLTLEANPSDKFSIYLGLDYAYNNYPVLSNNLLGHSTQSSGNLTLSDSNSGFYSPLPFSNMIGGNQPFGQKTDTPTLTTAYFTYQTDMGLFKAGRMPRNWGLGIWYNDQWSPTGGTISTSDAIAFTTDLTLFDVSVYYEKFSQSLPQTSDNNTGLAYSIEARLKNDPADAPSSGVTREIGIAYSTFEHSASNTTINTIDGYGRFYISKFFAGVEVLYPTGSTQSGNYQTLGGAAPCASDPTNNSNNLYKTCSTQDFSALAALAKFKLQLNGDENTSLAATDATQKLVGTAERETSQVIELWVGYASGGSNQFYAANNRAFAQGNSISAIAMNANIQPSFLMFNNTTPPVNGMPTGAVTNTTFAKLAYTYDLAGFGAMTPSVVWGKLNSTNTTMNTCTAENTVDATQAPNRLCVGEDSALGLEVDIGYRYKTRDHVDFGIDVGYWIVGDAWSVKGKDRPDNLYGARVFTGTEF